MSARAEPIFRRKGGTYVPTGHARGPWDPGQQHGGAPAALLAREMQALAGELRLARLTYELLGPVPLTALEVEASVARPGRRFALLEGSIVADGRVAVRVRAVALRRDEIELPAAARWTDPPPGGADPLSAAPAPFPAGPGAAEEGFHRTGMELRRAVGTHATLGPARVWFRLARPLVDDEAPSPLVRLCAAADFPNGISRVLDFDTHLFVNTDLTVTVLREPAGEWVLLDAVTRIDPSGTGWASSTLYDETGPLGFAQQTLFVAAR